MTEVQQKSWRDIDADNPPSKLTIGEKLSTALLGSLIVGGIVYGGWWIIHTDEMHSKNQEERKKALEETAAQNDGFIGSEYIGSNYINLNLGGCTLMGVEAEIDGKGSDINITSYSAPVTDRLTLSFRNMEELQKLVGSNPCAALIQK